MTTSQTEPEEATTEPAATPRAEGGHRHRTVRHVTMHGTAAGGISAAAGVLHAFGAAGLGVGAGVGVLVAGGTYAVRRAGKSRPRTGRVAPRIRRTSRTAAGSRATAGLRRDKTATRRTGSVATATRRRGSATGATGTRRVAGLRRGQSPSRTTDRGGRRVATTRRRPRPISTAPSARPARPVSRRGRTAAPSRPGGSTPASRTARAAATRTKTRRAAASRPTPRHAAPAKTAAKPTVKTPTTTARRPSSTTHARKVAKVARRQAIRGGKAIAAGAKGTKPYLRLRPPAAERAAEPAKKTPTAAAAKKTVASKPGAAVRRPVAKRPAARPGRAITAPGNERETVSDLNIPAAGLTAVMDAIDEHITGWEPDNAIEIFGFLAGLEGLYSHLGMALSNAADKLGGDYPLDRTVVDHLHEMAAHTTTLGAWGSQTHHLARAAHEGELQRLESPRPREEVFDVDHNR